ncbi:MAG: hypothetical protein Kapaf2KO_18890 [Candidatus Kapaibacteriales bacterium]
MLDSYEKITWNKDKDSWLRQDRNIGFDNVLEAIGNEGMLDIVFTPNQRDYPSQKSMVVKISNYVYYVPFKVLEDELILITIIPSRKLTKEYLK